MPDIKDTLEKAQRELGLSRETELVAWKQSYALTGIGYVLLAMVMIIEDLETGGEEDVHTRR